MSNPLGTTGLVLAWCLILSLVWAHLCFVVVAYRRRVFVDTLVVTRPAVLGSGMIMPALVAAPLTLLLAFRVASINLLFPVTLFAAPAELLRAAFAPALVLFCASGLGTTLTQQVQREYRYWQAQPFIRLSVALGKSAPRGLYKLVMSKALGSAWSQGLPWLFGELVVVEAVFNVPGLGLEAWHMARIQDQIGLLQCVGWLVMLYIACTTLTSWSNRRLGTRLASYG